MGHNVSTNAVTPELQLTPEQTLELEKVRAENAASRLELAKLQEQSAQASAEHAKLRQDEAHRDALLASGVKFYDPELTSRLTADFDIRYGDDGTATGVVAGKRVGLDKVYQAIAAKYPTIADGRTTRGLKADDVPTTKARSEMSLQEKMAYVDKHGLEAWERVPAYPMKTVVVKTREDFMSLPIKQRMDLQAEHGEHWLAHLPREPKQRKF